jgi:biotin carboxyl carrier protein
MRYKIELAGRIFEVDVARRPDGWGVRVDGGPERAWSGARLGAAEWRVGVEGVSNILRVSVEGDQWTGQSRGAFVGGAVADPRAAVAMASAGGQGTLKAPMPGMVSRVLVAVGDRVAAGQVLLVVEAMKMENEFKAKIAGVVRELHVAAGQAVAASAVLVTIDPHVAG